MYATQVKCGICEGDLDYDVVHGGYRYYKCLACGTSQVLPQPTQQELAAFYETFHSGDGGYSEFEDRVAADFPAKLALVRKHASVGGKLLDVGCGRGFFVKLAAQGGFDAEGIDFSQAAIDYAVQELGVSARQGALGPHSHPDWHRKFDVATFWATIEHVPNPQEVIAGIAECLKPGGLFVFDTGLAGAPFETWLAGHTQWYDAPQHLFVFSRRGLEVLLEKAGLQVIQHDANFERSLARRWIKALRFGFICVASFVVFRPALGRSGFEGARREAKWPIGMLQSIVARKK